MYANAHARLIERMAALLRGAGRNGPARVLRAETEIPDVPPLRWLGAQKTAERAYWSGRDDAFQWAAAGVAHRIVGTSDTTRAEAADLCAAVLDSSSPGVCFLGGFRFNADGREGPPWESFPAHRFVAPRVECVRAAGRTVLACNLSWSPGMQPNAALARLAGDLRALRPPAATVPNSFPAIDRRLDEPSFPKWRKGVQSVLEDCAQGTLAKVVLARRIALDLAAPIDACALLERLSADSRPCFAFLFQPGGEEVFLGATPELLYRRAGSELRAEALAGSCGRDPDPARDAALGGAFLHSVKELVEHRVVRATIQADLRELCSDLAPPVGEELVVLPHLRHLVTRFQGVLAPGITDGAILERLHPTAAVGGDPRAAALDAIAELENFDRGWYAAPVGWLARDAAEFAVAIRSAHCAGDRLTLFAGAGIVPGSDPAGEWEENERKLAPFLKALDGNGTRS